LLEALRRMLLPLDDIEIIMKISPFEIIEVVEYGRDYVIKARDCTPREIKELKSYLKKAGYKDLSRRIIVVCTGSSIQF